MPDRKKLRNQSQQQSLKKYIDNQNNIQSDQVARLGERDLKTGKDGVIYLNNSDVIAGQRVFSASLPLGAPMQATQPYGNAVVALNQRSYFEDEDVIEDESEQIGELKVLFSIFENGVTSFYIGGDRAVPLKILELPIEAVSGYITNTGKGKNDWICGFKYTNINGNNVIKSIGKNSHTWEISDPLTVQCTYQGWGYWTNDFIQTFPYLLSTFEDSSETRSDYYVKVSQETGSDVPIEDYIIVNNSNAPPDYNYVNTISKVVNSVKTNIYAVNSNGIINHNVGQEISTILNTENYKYDPNSPEYDYFPYGTVINNNTIRTKTINVPVNSLDIYKGQVNWYDGLSTTASENTLNYYLFQELKYELPQGYMSWASYETQSETNSSNDSESINAIVPILPGTQLSVISHTTSTYTTVQSKDFYQNSLENDPEEFYNENFSIDIGTSRVFQSTTLKQVYIPNIGIPTSFIFKTKSESTYSYPDTSTYVENFGIYLLNYTDAKVTDTDEVNFLDIRKTNLVKNVFYESPVEKITDDPTLGSIIEPAKYVDKNVTIEGNKYTVQIDGVVVKTTFKGIVQSLKIKSTDNYFIHGISYFPKK